MAKPLDRSRPLWEMMVINGSRTARRALLATVHHSVIGSGSGNDGMRSLLDMDPQRRPDQPAAEAVAPGGAAGRDEVAAIGGHGQRGAAVQGREVGLSMTRQLLMRRRLWPRWCQVWHHAVRGVLGPRTPFNVKPTNRRIFVPFRYHWTR